MPEHLHALVKLALEVVTIIKKKTSRGTYEHVILEITCVCVLIATNVLDILKDIKLCIKTDYIFIYQPLIKII